MTPIRGKGWLSRLHETAPVASLAAALVLPQLLPHDAGGQMDGMELAMVAAAVEAVPWRVGNWAGRDIPIPEAARRLLRPNAMLSRRFVDLSSGMAVDLTVIHCGDSRDMLGHYPPVCYPANGWVRTSRFDGSQFATLGSRRSGLVFAAPDDHSAAHGEAIELNLDSLTVPSRVYAFSRMRNWSEEVHIRIFNFFVLPDGTITRDIEDVGLRTNWLGSSVQGVAQIQVVTDAHVPFGDAVVAANEVLESLAAVFDSLGVKSPPPPNRKDP